MKRFKVEFQKHNGQILDAGMVPDNDGAWYHRSNVEELQAELTRLKELNREMAEVLNDVLCWQTGYVMAVKIRKLLAKAGGEGE
jgi:hypothetical protein